LTSFPNFVGSAAECWIDQRLKQVGRRAPVLASLHNQQRFSTHGHRKLVAKMRLCTGSLWGFGRALTQAILDVGDNLGATTRYSEPSNAARHHIARRNQRGHAADLQPDPVRWISIAK